MPINYALYDPTWKDIIRPDILRRAHHKCEHCGIANKRTGYREKDGTFVVCDEFTAEWAKRNGRRVFQTVLTIAHLDQDRLNNDYANLKALCQRCHLNHDRQYNIAKRLSNLKTQNHDKQPKSNYHRT